MPLPLGYGPSTVSIPRGPSWWPGDVTAPGVPVLHTGCTPWQAPVDHVYVIDRGGAGAGAAGSRGQPRPRSLRSLATWPVALTLYIAFSTVPCSSMTNVERITPVTVLPYSFFSPYAP